ncbi:MAG: hypothetical protein ACT4QC_15935 [Planctomycetaceae bacterium]
MPASGSGPLGALLILVPLAAIPIVAVVGVPHFAPLVASPADEEEIADLAPSPPAIRPAPAPAIRHADDLFAPLPGAAPTRERDRQRGMAETGGSQPPFGGDRPARPWVPPPEALDDWQVTDDESSHGARRKREVVSIDEFDGGLLMPAAGDRAVRGREINSPSDPRGAAARGRNPAGLQSRASVDNEALAQLQLGALPAAALPPGWPAAARRLKELGIRQYRLEAKIEEQRFSFRCVFAVGGTADTTRIFEADADDPLDAVLEVLEQVDAWQGELATAEPETDQSP